MMSIQFPWQQSHWRTRTNECLNLGDCEKNLVLPLEEYLTGILPKTLKKSI